MSLDTARRVLRIEAQAIQDVLVRLDATFEKAVDVLFACKGRVVVTGMGKSGLIGRKISATLSSTGTPSFFLHAAEALHGDMGMLARGDAMLAVSYGGGTGEIIRFFEGLKRLGKAPGMLAGERETTLAPGRGGVLGGSGEGRGVFVEPRAHREQHRGDGGGRCPRSLVAGTAQFSS